MNKQEQGLPNIEELENAGILGVNLSTKDIVAEVQKRLSRQNLEVQGQKVIDHINDWPMESIEDLFTFMFAKELAKYMVRSGQAQRKR